MSSSTGMDDLMSFGFAPIETTRFIESLVFGAIGLAAELSIVVDDDSNFDPDGIAVDRSLHASKADINVLFPIKNKRIDHSMP